jgi:hypothetical protein
MPTYNQAGADAAGTYDEMFRQIIANDPDVQAVIRRVWGNTPVSARPSDTPKALEKANDAASKEIAQILARKGIPLPDRTFVNPRTASLEGHRGWAGLSGLQKAAIIGAAGAAGGFGLGALGAFGGAGGAGAGGGSAAAGGAGIPATMGGSALAGLGTGGVGTGIGAGVGTAAATGAAGTAGLWGRLAQSALSPQGIGAIGSALTGMAKGAEADRAQGVNYQLGRDRLGLDAQAQYERDLQSRRNQEMEQRDLASRTGTTAFQNALRASNVSGFQPAARPQGVPTISFVHPTQGGRDAADAMSREAMLRLMEGEKFDPLPPLQPYALSSPTSMPGQSLLEKILGPLGLAGQTYSNFTRPRQGLGTEGL